MTRLSYWVFSLIDLEKLLLLTCHFLYLSDTTGVFTRCILKESAIILCTRSITTGDFTRCVLFNESAVRLCQARSQLVISPDSAGANVPYISKSGTEC